MFQMLYLDDIPKDEPTQWHRGLLQWGECVIDSNSAPMSDMLRDAVPLGFGRSVRRFNFLEFDGGHSLICLEGKSLNHVY